MGFAFAWLLFSCLGSWLAASPILTDGSAHFVYLTGAQDFSRSALQSDTDIYIHPERSEYTTTSDITVNILIESVSDAGTYSSNPGNETLSSGAYVDVYLLHMDVYNSQTHVDAGSITFDHDIVGIIATRSNLNDTDGNLGDPNSDYTPRPYSRGFWESDDVLTISSDLRTITIDSIRVSSRNSYADQIRILVEAPEPSTFLILLLAGGMAAMVRRPRSHRVPEVDASPTP